MNIWIFHTPKNDDLFANTSRFFVCIKEIGFLSVFALLGVFCFFLFFVSVENCRFVPGFFIRIPSLKGWKMTSPFVMAYFQRLC